MSKYVCVVVFIVTLGASVSAAQSPQAPAPAEHQHGAEAPAAPGHSMTRDGSGTSWLPDGSPMYAIHWQKGAWQLMAHENVFVQFLHESGDRGADQSGSINWLMGMAERKAGRGRLQLRGMFSAEPWTIRGCGYPDLLATGEQCNGETIHDRQHPHDLLMEMAAAYDAPLTGSVRWQVYGGPAGEPALGPVAFPHRVSAMPNPLAPLAHHWLDSTHIAFGVMTAGVYGDRWKAEASAFNGREPDEHRADVDFGALDSVSGRVSFLPTPNVALQVSSGRLTDAEASETGGAATDVMRVTASAVYHRALGEGGIWASTVAWGRNSEGDHSTNALLLESNVTLDDRDTWFGRLEIAGKTAHDLDVPGDDIFTVSKLQGGYTRYFDARKGLRPGIGFSVSSGVVPDTLRSAYGSRANVGFGMFATMRPAALVHAAAAAAPGAAAPAMVMVQTALDPSKLTCSPAIDPRAAATTMYQGTTYYFCSARERDEFLTNPAMSLAMMPPKR